MFVWRGFRHSWTYNHRLNRLGNWLDSGARESPESVATAHHAARSGSGDDTAEWLMGYSVPRAHGVRFIPLAPEVFWLRSHEGRRVEQRRSCAVRLPDDLALPDRRIVLLNGFELVSNRDADKLRSFSLLASEPVVDTTSRELTFELTVALEVDCDSLECTVGEGAETQTDYTLTLRLLVVLAPAHALTITSATASNAYEWDREHEVRLEEQGVRTITFPDPEGGWDRSVPAIRGFAVTLTREEEAPGEERSMHLLELDIQVNPVEGQGPPYATVELFARNWREEPSPYGQSALSFRMGGRAEFHADVSRLRFTRGNGVRHDVAAGTFTWDATARTGGSGSVPLSEPWRSGDWLSALVVATGGAL